MDDVIRSPDAHVASALFRKAPKCQKIVQVSFWPAACLTTRRDKEIQEMLWTIAVILIVLWALGMLTAFTASGLIHILLVLAIVVVVIRLIQGRRAI